jgi:hypothetical protein
MPIKNAAEKESDKELKEKDKDKDKNNNVKKLGTYYRNILNKKNNRVNILWATNRFFTILNF